jgi:DNA-binding transcriptional ArsR family regulator
VLRILFSSADLTRIRIAHRPDPLWELLLAVQLLRRQPGDLLFTAWRAEVTAQLHRAGLGEPLRLLLNLMPHVGYFPDFLNPIASLNGLENGLEAIRSTPKRALERDLRQLALTRRLLDSARLIAAGTPRALVELTDTMRNCHDLIVLPFRRGIDTAFDRDRQAKLDALAGTGVHGLLNTLAPYARWSAGELRIPHYRDQELRLDGRGLILIPAYFCIGAPVTMFDPDLPPVLVHPISPQPHPLPGNNPVQHTAALAALIGTTRAAVLDTIATRHTTTTTELANQLTMSMASTSDHTKILRQAGLITSHRDRNRLLHRLTPLGHALLTDSTPS